MSAPVNLSLSDLDLGAPAAERDIQKGLNDYFVESEAFKRVLNRSKTIVIGNRGSGKSAIFQVIAARERVNKTHVIELAPEDYSYELLRQSMVAESSGSWAKLGAYAVAWKYLIYVLVMKAISKDVDRAGKGKALARISRYVRDHHENAQYSKLSAMISYLKRLEGVKIGKYEAALKTRELEKLYKLEEVHHLIPDLKEVLKNQRVIVLVDELDRGWDASEDAQAFVAGLFQACVSINLISPGLTVYMSLRQELYDNIPALYDDAQKYRDLIETISWNEKSLRQLIARRIRHSMQQKSSWRARDVLSNYSDGELWDSLFAETLGYRQTKSFNYMVDRTLYRPRELIQFCAQAIDVARDSGTSAPLDYGVLTEAEVTYSDQRRQDIAAEYRFQYPGLGSLFELFRGKSYLFDRNDLEYMCLEMITGEMVTDAEAAQWLDACEPEAVIEILWQVGFLRAQAVGGIKAQRRSGSSYLGPHQVRNLNLSNIMRFQVHPMFRSGLGLKEPKARSSS